MPRNALYAILVVALVAALAFGGVKVFESAKDFLRLGAMVPDVANRVRNIRAELAGQGIKTLVGQTYRTEDAQTDLVEGGASATQRSWHRVRRAIDLYPYREGQDWDKGSWEDYKTMYAIAEKYGGENLGEGSDGNKRYITTSSGKIWDGGHLQFPDGLSWDEAYAQA